MRIEFLEGNPPLGQDIPVYCIMEYLNDLNSVFPTSNETVKNT